MTSSIALLCLDRRGDSQPRALGRTRSGRQRAFQAPNWSDHGALEPRVSAMIQEREQILAAAQQFVFHLCADELRRDSQPQSLGFNEEECARRLLSAVRFPLSQWQGLRKKPKVWQRLLADRIHVAVWLHLMCPCRDPPMPDDAAEVYDQRAASATWLAARKVAKALGNG